MSSQLDELREFEVSQIIGLFPKGGRILEPGAGTGAQAAFLSSYGFTVEALEIESSNYRNARGFPVRVYDGRVFPFDSNSFDAVYTSNVLEHVPDLRAFLAECRRVLIDGGVMIMVVPTATWRLWSIPAYYPARVREILTAGSSVPSSHGEKRRLRLSSFFPSTHGERGNTITEMWWMSRWVWRRVFREAGLTIRQERTLRTFATGEFLSSASPSTRTRLSRWLGSSARVFELE